MAKRRSHPDAFRRCHNPNRILDEAERLFAIDGFAGVSVRQITAAAGSDLAQVNYYFGSKDQLFHEILIRRVDEMSKIRQGRLQAIKRTRNNPGNGCSHPEAFLIPLIGTTPEEILSLRNYRHLIALVTNSKIWQEKVFKEHYDPMAYQFVDALAEVLPDAPKDSILWIFTFFLGTAVNALAETGRIDRLSRGRCKSSNLADAASHMIDFYAGGLMDLAKVHGARKRRKT